MSDDLAIDDDLQRLLLHHAPTPGDPGTCVHCGKEICHYIDDDPDDWQSTDADSLFEFLCAGRSLNARQFLDVVAKCGGPVKAAQRGVDAQLLNCGSLRERQERFFADPTAEQRLYDAFADVEEAVEMLENYENTVAGLELS